MSSPGWDTTSDPTTRRPGGRDRIALVVGISLLVIVILAALTGKVLASNPPALADSSPTADHIEQKAPVHSPKPPDPESLFLDLPDPPPPTPKAVPQNTSSQPAPSPGSSSESAAARSQSVPVRSQGRPDDGAGRNVGGTSDIPISKADFETLPSSPTVQPGSGNAKDLLADPDCRFSDVARADLEAGVVDEYLISALQAVCRKHSIYVNVFKTGHTFGPGLAEGPKIPVGYGNAGGYPNTHYFGRAADIWKVDGKPVEGNGADPAVVSVGRMLAGLPTENRPDVVIGPAAWNRELGYGPEQGWVIDADQVALHADHLHVGYWHGDGTPPPRVFLSPEQEPFYTNTAPIRRTRHAAEKNTTRTTSTKPKLKEIIEPVESPGPRPRPGGDAKEPEPRKETTRQRSVTRKVQRSEIRITDSRHTNSSSTSKKPEKGKAPETSPEESKQPDQGGGVTKEETTSGTTNASSQYSNEEITETGATQAEETSSGDETTPATTGARN